MIKMERLISGNSAANQWSRRLGPQVGKASQDGDEVQSVGPVGAGDAGGGVVVVGELAVLWEFKCGSESGCDGASNAGILCCGAASSCGYGCCSGFGFCCGYESVSARSSGSVGRPPLRGCKLSRPRKTHNRPLSNTQPAKTFTNSGITYRLQTWNKTLNIFNLFKNHLTIQPAFVQQAKTCILRDTCSLLPAAFFPPRTAGSCCVRRRSNTLGGKCYPTSSACTDHSDAIIG